MSEMTDKENIKILGIVAAVGIIGIVLMYIAAMSPFQSIGKGESVDLVGGATKKAECNDKIDNDKDGKIDYPNDKGCTSKSDTSEYGTTQCDNGKDDDNDGKIDYPKDGGCDSLTDSSEAGGQSAQDPIGNGPQCNDGIDNDWDGLIDYPNDPGCDSPAGITERSSLLDLHSSILPTSRSVQVGQTATAFATILASGTGTARGCRITPRSSIPASFSFQTTDPTTNQVIGTPNTPVDIPGGGGQSFVISLTPTAPIPSTNVQFSFDCDNTEPAPILVGVNTLLLTASSTPVADIIALAATPSNDGILNIPVNGAAAFSIATTNAGASALITAYAYAFDFTRLLTLTICETNPSNAQCKSPPASYVTTQIDAGATPTFSVFATAYGAIPFDPAVNRIFVEFTEDGLTRGSTSVAVRTQ